MISQVFLTYAAEVDQLGSSSEMVASTELEVKRKLITARKQVKRKLQSLKESAAGRELLLTRTYKPITKSIQNLKSQLANDIKTEIIKAEQQPPSKEETVAVTSTPTRRLPKRVDAFTTTDPKAGPSFLETEDIGEIDTTSSAIPQHTSQESIDEAYEAAREAYWDYVNGPRFAEFLEEFDPLPRSYIEGLLTDFDGKYNNEVSNLRKDKVRYEWNTNTFFIGNTEIKFLGPNLCIGNNVCYRGTIGLYELLFKLDSNYPFSIQERKDYADILKRTNARYSLRTNKKGGRGLLLDLNDKPIEYVYFDDVNELCERLKLLLASQQAGNNNHTNEIVSILEELRECDIIE